MRTRAYSTLFMIAFLVSVLFMGITSIMIGMREGADTLGDSLPAQDFGIVYRDFTQDEWQAWVDGYVQYNVDVKVPNSHAWQRHGDDQVSKALRCVNEFGTQAVISMNADRRLNLLCLNPETKEEFVVVIEKIQKAKDQFSNATSRLVTAFRLEHGSNIGSYIQNEVITGGKGMLVRLKFSPGEIFFMPY